MAPDQSPIASVVLNDQGRTDLSVYGFRSWLLQKIDRPYEVIVNVFNPRRQVFEALTAGKNPLCRVIINTYDPPEVFNISAANNLGLNAASGKYVLFANADIVHLSDFLQLLTDEMESRNLHYVNGTRANLSPEQTAQLPAAQTRTLEQNFDFLRGSEAQSGLPPFHALSPWVTRRETVLAIGGFDPRVYCSEDADLDDRFMHYLRRTGQQKILFTMKDAMGYHLHHKPSDIHAMGPASQALLRPRRDRLRADPNSAEDVVPTPIHSREQLLEILRKSAKPDIPLKQATREMLPWWLRQFLSRARKANRMLWKGHL